MSTGTSIIDIFNSMSCNDCETDNTDDEKIRKLYPNLENVERIESLHSATEKVLWSKTNKNWRETPVHMKALVLLDVGRRLSEEAPKLSGLQNFPEKDYSLLIDTFYYYSNICYQLEKYWIPYEHVFLILSSDVPYSMLGSVISSVFGVGCPVTVIYSIENPWFLLFLKHVFSRTTLPNDLFTLVPKCELEEINSWPRGQWTKIVFFGDHLSAMDIYERAPFKSFSFVNANNTATIIFESCDLSAAIDRIFYETWDEESATIWGVSTAVVQESVYQKFLDRLNLRIDQLTDEQEGVLIKNCIISEKDRNRKTEPDLPVLKVFSCRTANEGVDLLNGYQYYSGTSIWSENSSQALEVASKLICNNVWINCHGIIDPSVPFSSSDNNGRVAFGGYEDILEYFEVKQTLSLSEKMNFGHKKIQVNVEETVLSAQKAFKKWLLMENKGMYLTEIAASLKNSTQLSVLSDLITEVLSAKNKNSVPKSYNKNFYIIQEQSPIGVIVIILKHIPNLELLVYLITTAIALGNAVILVQGEYSDTLLIESLVDVFDSHLPKDLLSVITENDEDTASTLLASNPNVQALWFSEGYELDIKKISSKTLKRIWSFSNVTQREEFHSHALIFQRECKKNKIIWLAKVDHFP